jgi:formylglycine-generating enzyme
VSTEAEWEFAARGGVDSDLKFPWGKQLKRDKQHMANVFQGQFPQNNTALDGFEFMSPVDSFPPQNGLGLHNMIGEGEARQATYTCCFSPSFCLIDRTGNVWEWVSDWWTIDHRGHEDIPTDPTGPTQGTDKVKKGGSFLCHKSYCYRSVHATCMAWSQYVPCQDNLSIYYLSTTTRTTTVVAMHSSRLLVWLVTMGGSCCC